MTTAQPYVLKDNKTCASSCSTTENMILNYSINGTNQTICYSKCDGDKPYLYYDGSLDENKKYYCGATQCDTGFFLIGSICAKLTCA